LRAFEGASRAVAGAVGFSAPQAANIVVTAASIRLCFNMTTSQVDGWMRILEAPNICRKSEN
jgi:hypothetical protein